MGLWVNNPTLTVPITGPYYELLALDPILAFLMGDNRRILSSKGKSTFVLIKMLLKTILHSTYLT